MSDVVAARVVARLVEKSFVTLLSWVKDDVLSTLLLLFELRFKEAPNVAASVEPLVLGWVLSAVPLFARPPLAACLPLIAEPVFDEVLPPLDALLLDVE